MLFADEVFGQLSRIRNCVKSISKSFYYLAFEMIEATYFSFSFLLLLFVEMDQGKMKC